MIRLLCLAIGYLFGLFQTSYILGRVHGIDIREYGSHNAGTTNMLRTMGLKAGLLTYPSLNAFPSAGRTVACRIFKDFGRTYSSGSVQDLHLIPFFITHLQQNRER